MIRLMILVRIMIHDNDDLSDFSQQIRRFGTSAICNGRRYWEKRQWGRYSAPAFCVFTNNHWGSPNFASFWSLKNRSSRIISSPSRGDSKDIKPTRKHQQTRSFSDWTCEHRLFRWGCFSWTAWASWTWCWNWPPNSMTPGVALCSEPANHLVLNKHDKKTLVKSRNWPSSRIG